MKHYTIPIADIADELLPETIKCADKVINNRLIFRAESREEAAQVLAGRLEGFFVVRMAESDGEGKLIEFVDAR